MLTSNIDDNMYNVDKLIFCGDIHGEFSRLIWNATNHKIANACIIICGDFGIGFNKEKRFTMDNSARKKMKDFNLYVKAIRGNHDDPSYFDGKHNENRVEFLQDHVPFEVLGKTIYPIGGATSIDKWDRIEANKKSDKKCYWWGNENIVKKDINSLPDNVDIIISHEAPLSFEPVYKSTNRFSSDIYDAISEDRKYLDEVEKKIKYNKWYFGHYHKSIIGQNYRCLDIQELLPYYDYEDEEIEE